MAQESVPWDCPRGTRSGACELREKVSFAEPYASLHPVINATLGKRLINVEQSVAELTAAVLVLGLAPLAKTSARLRENCEIRPSLTMADRMGADYRANALDNNRSSD